jgi:hypothetical protein
MSTIKMSTSMLSTRQIIDVIKCRTTKMPNRQIVDAIKYQTFCPQSP